METDSRVRGRPPGKTGTELLEVAREQFLRRGFRGATVSGIAAAAGISKQTLYAAYPSKDDLFAAVIRDWVDRGRDAMRPALTDLLDTPDVRTGLRDFARALQAGILSRPVLQLRALVAAEANAFPEIAAGYLSRSWDDNLRALARTLAELTARGVLTVDNPEVAAQQFVWLVIGAPLNELSLADSRHEYPLAGLRQVADEAVATFLSRHLLP